MNKLQLVQELHRECRYPGNAPTTLAGATGQTADLSAWVRDAYHDIQLEHDGEWRWLIAKFTFNTTASDGEYASGDVNDVATAAAIDRFRRWVINDRHRPPFIYLTSAGVGSQVQLSYLHNEDFRLIYELGTQNDSQPVNIAESEDQNILLGPAPGDIYTITGEYMKTSQFLGETLVGGTNVDTEVPEMPAEYHRLIVYEAMAKYAYTQVAPEILARANNEGGKLWKALRKNQLLSRSRFRQAQPLA